MGHGSHAECTDRKHEHAGLLECGYILSRRPEAWVHANDNDSGIDLIGLQNKPLGLANRFRDALRIGVVFNQPIAIMLQCVECTCGDDSNLAHSTAEKFAVT